MGIDLTAQQMQQIFSRSYGQTNADHLKKQRKADTNWVVSFEDPGTVEGTFDLTQFVHQFDVKDQVTKNAQGEAVSRVDRNININELGNLFNSADTGKLQALSDVIDINGDSQTSQAEVTNALHTFQQHKGSLSFSDTDLQTMLDNPDAYQERMHDARGTGFTSNVNSLLGKVDAYSAAFQAAKQAQQATRPLTERERLIALANGHAVPNDPNAVLASAQHEFQALTQENKNLTQAINQLMGNQKTVAGMNQVINPTTNQTAPVLAYQKNTDGSTTLSPQATTPSTGTTGNTNVTMQQAFALFLQQNNITINQPSVAPPPVAATEEKPFGGHGPLTLGSAMIYAGTSLGDNNDRYYGGGHGGYDNYESNLDRYYPQRGGGFMGHASRYLNMGSAFHYDANFADSVRPGIAFI